MQLECRRRMRQAPRGPWPGKVPDARETPGCSRALQGVIYGRIGDLEIPDLIAVLESAALIDVNLVSYVQEISGAARVL